MKKIFFILIAIFAIAFMACHKKAVPTFTTRSIDIPAPTKKTNATADLESGKNTFTAKCNRCHDLPDPVKYNSQRWDGILPIMIPRAKLSKDDADNVTAYLKANCAK